jgi:C1A family cysteine protease
MYLNYLDTVYPGKNYESDDDDVFEALSSEDMENKSKSMIANGEAWMKDFLKDRVDADGNQTSYNFLNNVVAMLAEVATYLTNNEIIFQATYRSKDDIRTELNLGYPVILSGKFTKSGHYVLIVGFDDDSKNWIVNDPYGDWNSGYVRKGGLTGKALMYSMDKVDAIMNVKDSAGRYYCVAAKTGIKQ